LAAPAPAELAPHFPQLEILELLGQGGMGAVYKARQPKLDRLVALKILPAEAGADAHFAERFNREARALARLDHPNIVRVHDFGDSGGFHYFIMEYVEGVNLRQVMRAGDLKPEQALKLIPQICEALQYAHDEGIVHRDIKPENILLDKKGRVKIADFGLAKLLARTPADFTLTATHQVMGTPHYMAPEQMDKPQTVDHRADIYSLGVVLYEMLTGELPLGRFAPPSQQAPVDARLDAIVFRALAREPEWRYQHVSEVKTAVDAITNGIQAVLPALVTSAVAPVKRHDEEVELEMLRMQVTPAAVGLLFTGVLALVALTGIGMLSLAAVCTGKDVGWDSALHYSNFYFAYLFAIFLVASVSALPIIAGARRMRQLEKYESALGAAVWAMLLCTFLLVEPFFFLSEWPTDTIGPIHTTWMMACGIYFLVSLPVGIWALSVLRNPKIKAEFAQQALLHRQIPSSKFPAPPTPEPTGPVRRRLRSLMQSVVSLVMGSRPEKGSSLTAGTDHEKDGNRDTAG
jgi:tRNA A-37 threonylcarbamoyl transferase component Bud32